MRWAVGRLWRTGIMDMAVAQGSSRGNWGLPPTGTSIACGRLLKRGDSAPRRVVGVRRGAIYEANAGRDSPPERRTLAVEI